MHCTCTHTHTHTHTNIDTHTFMHAHAYNLCLLRNGINTWQALKCQPVSNKVHKDPIYLWIWHFSRLSALELFSLSKCVFRARRRRRRRRRRREMKMWTDRLTDCWERCVAPRLNEPSQRGPRGSWYFNPHFGVKCPSEWLFPPLTRGCDQRVAFGDKNNTNVG